MGSPHGGSLDEQIEQLMQCKPLSEPEVPLSSLRVCFEFWVSDFCGFWLVFGRFGVGSTGPAGGICGTCVGSGTVGGVLLCVTFFFIVVFILLY